MRRRIARWKRDEAETAIFPFCSAPKRASLSRSNPGWLAIYGVEHEQRLNHEGHEEHEGKQ
jgi:hypothetical protein